MLIITNNIQLADKEIELNAIQAQGPGGQNVNKVATAIQLRFNINNSSLPQYCKERLLRQRDRRITNDGEIIIKAQEFRTQAKNRASAVNRLIILINNALKRPKKRVPTKPTRNSKKRRMDNKTKHATQKKLRGKVKH